mmetsp:Transcript_13893/g.41234  ORF Transcript_13893/g.41234 Transcript_13893/m.41234 type:complete len:332 (+) Transcript_13893:1058-2053(+)
MGRQLPQGAARLPAALRRQRRPAGRVQGRQGAWRGIGHVPRLPQGGGARRAAAAVGQDCHPAARARLAARVVVQHEVAGRDLRQAHVDALRLLQWHHVGEKHQREHCRPQAAAGGDRRVEPLQQGQEGARSRVPRARLQQEAHRQGDRGDRAAQGLRAPELGGHRGVPRHQRPRAAPALRDDGGLDVRLALHVLGAPAALAQGLPARVDARGAVGASQRAQDVQGRDGPLRPPGRAARLWPRRQDRPHLQGVSRVDRWPRPREWPLLHCRGLARARREAPQGLLPKESGARAAAARQEADHQGGRLPVARDCPQARPLLARRASLAAIGPC